MKLVAVGLIVAVMACKTSSLFSYLPPMPLSSVDLVVR
jgi:hypothetical protein